MMADRDARIRTWVAEPPPADVRRVLKRLASAIDVEAVAVMPDVHLAEEVCIGTVVATRRALYPQAVGGDIGCGMAAMAFDCEASLLDNPRSAAGLLAGLYGSVPFLKHRAPQELPIGLRSAGLSEHSLTRRSERDGAHQLGTLGRGNHFLELQEDEEGALWLMVHSGSRAMGQAIREHHLKKCRAQKGGPGFLWSDTEEGRAYLADHRWALDYAEANRRRMSDAVSQILLEKFGVSAVADSYFSCHHNHVAREVINGESLWIHRKGAISAKEGESGIIPGSMGTASYHVEGRGNVAALFSSSHGAGRTMARSRARQEISVKQLERQLGRVWFDRKMAYRLREEAPEAYKDITAVMRAQKELTRVVRKLRPVLSFKGG